VLAEDGDDELTGVFRSFNRALDGIGVREWTVPAVPPVGQT